MEIKQLTKGPEQVFGVFKNAEAVLLNGGTPVCIDYTTTADGIRVILPTTAMLHAFAGCVRDGEVLGTSGQPDEYGLVQIYGHHPGVYMVGTTVSAGAMMVPVNTKSYVSLATTHADSTVEAPNEAIAFVIAGTAGCLIATSTFGNTYRAFIRAM